MPQLIAFGNELIRINLSNNHIEASTTRGSSWMIRYSGNAADGHLYVSTTKGASWFRRK